MKINNAALLAALIFISLAAVSVTAFAVYSQLSYLFPLAGAQLSDTYVADDEPDIAEYAAAESALQANAEANVPANETDIPGVAYEVTILDAVYTPTITARDAGNENDEPIAEEPAASFAETFFETSSESSTETTYETPDEEFAFVIDYDFAQYPFYIPGLENEYVSFAEANPAYTSDTVVWMVNVSLHKPFYSEYAVNYDADPLLVNPYNRLPDDFVPRELVPVYDGSPRYVTPETRSAFLYMQAAAAEEGYMLDVQSSYRTAERQKELYDARGVDGAVARPYFSEHQIGRAIDLWGDGLRNLLDNGKSTQSAEAKWVADNAHMYGFILRYRADTRHITGYIYEPWHVTYVGEYIARYMFYNDIKSLEEYVGRNPGAVLGVR